MQAIFKAYNVASFAVDLYSGGLAGGAKAVAEEIVFGKLSRFKPIAKMGDEVIGFLGKIWSRGVNLKLGLKYNSATLRHNMEQVLGPLPHNHAPHHIVPSTSPAMKKLEDMGIDPNSPSNGIALPRKDGTGSMSSAHGGRHCRQYYQYVERLIGGAEDKEGVINVLSLIRQDLLSCCCSRVYVMSSDPNEELREVLSGVGLVDDKKVGMDWWVHQRDKYRVPVLEVALFLRESWKRIVSDDPGAIESLVETLEKRDHDDDGYQSSQLRANPGFAIAIRRALTDPELGPALRYLVRAAQIESVFSLVVLIDGGESFEDGRWASWNMAALDQSSDLGDSFGDIKELFWHFDPAQRANKKE